MRHASGIERATNGEIRICDWPEAALHGVPIAPAESGSVADPDVEDVGAA